MKHAPLLRIVQGKVAIEIAVPASFVAIVPEKNGRVVHVTLDHFLHEAATDLGVVSMLPTGEFIEHVESQFIAGLQKRLIRRIVRHSHGIHVHRLDQAHIRIAVV